MRQEWPFVGPIKAGVATVYASFSRSIAKSQNEDENYKSLRYRTLREGGISVALGCRDIPTADALRVIRASRV